MSFDEAALLAELPTMRRWAYAWLPHEADDLVQATCEKALRCRDQFTDGNLQAWLATMMQRLRYDMIRGESYRVYESLDNMDRHNNSIADTRPHWSAQEPTVLLHEAVAKLGENSMLLPTAFGYTGDEIAANHSTTRQKVQRQVFDERRALWEWFLNET